MSEHFLRLKRHLGRMALLKSLLYGISAGAFGAAFWLICCKKGWLSLPSALGIAVGVGLFLLVGLTLFLILRPGDRKTARRIDAAFSLREKVQTMLDFQSETGEIVEMQREDAEAVLATAPAKGLAGRHRWLHGIAPVLAAAVMAVSLALPAYTEAPPVTDPPPEGPVEVWALTDWHVAAVQALIAEVKASEMEEEGKTATVSHLENMLAALQSVQTRDVMVKTVTTAMVKIDAVCDELNSYTGIIRVLSGDDNGTVITFAEAMGSPAEPIDESKWQALKVSFSANAPDRGAGAFGTALNMAVDGSPAASDDALLVAIKQFAGAMTAFGNNAENMTADEATAAFDKLFEDGAAAIGAVLGIQRGNRDTADHAISELMRIFDISFSELPDELKNSNSAEQGGTGNGDYNDKDDDETVAPGGLGTGDRVYGSDDAVYDEKTESHVVYGEIIDRYDAVKTETLENKKFSDELRDFIDKYFADLYRRKEENN